MSAAQTGAPCLQKSDPQKRVNYTFGMVLGVDEFNQEAAYLIGKDHSQYRLAHGYGTICGLQVSIPQSPDLEVQVSTGVAINPRGQEIHVRQQMCARLNDWLTTNQSTLQALYGTPPFSLSLCVVLGYRSCPTDTVPVPGQPCRTQQDSMAASRIADSFQLKLCINSEPPTSSPSSPPIDAVSLAGLCYAPAQLEENAIRRFGRLLHRIRIVDLPSSITEAQLLSLVRQLGTETGVMGSPYLTSPPYDESPIDISTHDAREFLRSAFLVWVTEIRPTLMAKANGCNCSTPDEDSVLLADLDLTVSGAWQVVGTVNIDQSRRPYLLESRLLQEWFLSEGESGGAVGSNVVAAGVFTFVGTQAVPAGPTVNGLNATLSAPGTYFLNWGGPAPYSNPALDSPPQISYIVKGTAMGAVPASPAPGLGFQVLGFASQGVQVAITGANPTGFMVEISEIATG
ncbi:MAG TPA: hypothetical protein VE178_11605 [Silvibacterium sp.]|jgi:hypothetical protein|nr:hypothetical protein [Silvibacterium sp.]